MLIFANTYHSQKPRWVMWVGVIFIEKRLLTLFLDTQKLRNFLISVENEAMVDALWCVYAYRWCYQCLATGNSQYYGLLYTYRREASALLVQQRWAMRRPLSVGRVACTGSHAFFCIVKMRIHRCELLSRLPNFRLCFIVTI